MRKRLIVELEEEALRSGMGAVLKTGADFRVESIETEVQVRTLQKKTPDGKGPKEVILEAVGQYPDEVSLDALLLSIKRSGFHEQTLRANVRALAAEDKLLVDGQTLFCCKE